MSDSISYEIESYRTWTSGTRVHLYLDPEERHVQTWAMVGSGCPEAAYHGRWLRLATVPRDIVPDSLAAWLKAHEDKLADVCDSFEDCHGNRVGKWEQSDIWDRLCWDLEEALQDQTQISQYWEADYYCDGDPASLVEDAVKLGREAFIAAELLTAEKAGVHLDGDELARSVKELIPQYITDDAVEALRNEAAVVGDEETVVICDRVFDEDEPELWIQAGEIIANAWFNEEK